MCVFGDIFGQNVSIKTANCGVACIYPNVYLSLYKQHNKTLCVSPGSWYVLGSVSMFEIENSSKLCLSIVDQELDPTS